MAEQKTRLTQKNQTTVPKEVRNFLNVKSGGEVEWHIVKGMVFLDTHKTIKNPVKFLTSQTRLSLDAVKLVKESREEFG